MRYFESAASDFGMHSCRIGRVKSMRQADGVNTRCMKEEFESFHSFKGVIVYQPNDSDHRKAEVFRELFFDSLADNVEHRLDDNGIISATATFTSSKWPSDEDKRILYGDDKLLTMQKIPKGIPPIQV